MITRFLNKLVGSKTAEHNDSPKKSSPSKPAKSAKDAPVKARSAQQPKPKIPAVKDARHDAGKVAPKKAAATPKQRVAWDPSEFDVPPLEGKTRFQDLDLPDELLHAIHDLGFEYCSPIQAQILPHALRGLDAIGKAQTGTGKTAAFLITIIDELINNPIMGKRFLKEPRAVIVAPTRELVVQIGEDAKGLCKYTDLNIVTLIGGADYVKQQNAMSRHPVDIVVATPGRLIDFMTRKDINLSYVELLVLDEADRMLDMGFIPQVRRIVRATPEKKDRQTQLFSATFTQDIINLSEQWTYEPVYVEVEPESVATDTVDQKVYLVSQDEKLQVLKNILKLPEIDLAIVFANRRDQVQRLYQKLEKSGFSVGVLSGEVAQNKRSRTLEDFKKRKIKIIVATDVMGRGIHVDGVTHVINYNLPEDPEDYVHRIGRTGRAGASGISISLACESDAFQLPDIEAMLGKKMKCQLPPESLLG